MELLDIQNPQSVAIAGRIVLDGGVILYPTDTLYGLGANALSDKSVDAIYTIKGRDKNKPIHAVVADIDMAREYGECNDIAELLAQHFLPGPLTLVVPKRAGLESGIFRDMQTVGIRIPNNSFCIALAREVKVPITTTSANKSNEAPQYTLDAIATQLGESAQHVALAIDAGELRASLPSTVVEVSGKTIKILREGAILASEIAKVVPF